VVGKKTCNFALPNNERGFEGIEKRVTGLGIITRNLLRKLGKFIRVL
jgi:hypothetical protein